MLFVFYIILCFFASTMGICEQEVFKISGTLNVIGIFNLQTGENCSVVNPSAQESAQNLITSVEAVRKINLDPNVEIGLSIFNLCSNQGKKLENSCLDTGGLILQGYSDQDLYQNYTFPVFKIQQTSQQYSKIIAKAIFDLKLTPINHLVIEKSHYENEIIKELTDLHICILNVTNLDKMSNIKGGRVIIIVGEYDRIKKINTDFSDSTVLVVPTDGIYDDLKDWNAHKLYVLMPSRVEIGDDLDFDDVNSTRIDEIYDMTLQKTSLSQIQMVYDVANLVKMSKMHIANVCKNLTICQQIKNHIFHSATIPVKTREIPYQLKILNINMEDSTCAVIFERSSSLIKIGEVKLSGTEWNVEFESGIEIKDIICEDCSQCSNYIEVYTSALVLRGEAWVAALLSVSAVGLISCLAIAIFILVRICKKDTLEGNPSFSFLMLVSLILVYISILPYAFKTDNDDPYLSGILCGLKVIGTSFSYSLVFSVMLARSLMLASCDEDGGFMSHVNGYLQSVLCFFITAVQVALTVQFWAINWFFTDHEQCKSMTQGPLFIYLLGYDVFLLILLILISPFIMRSKRNYEEGGYFASSSILCLLVWISWASGYLYLPEYSDIFICSGLVATASVILVVVFIPRTYLMMTGIVRDHLVSTLPTFNHTTSSVIDVNYRSTQALYDSVSTRGMNPNYYTERPTTPSTSKMEERADINPYDNFDRSPSPRNVTRF